MALRILGVQLVLDVPAPDDATEPSLLENDAARLARIFLDRLPPDRLELLRRDDHGAPAARRRPPPASAGMIVTSSPSLSAVRWPWSDSIASPVTEVVAWSS